MILTVLSVVFRHKDRHVFPEASVRQEVDELAESQIIVGDIGGAIGITFVGAWRCGVIVTESARVCTSVPY
jgi:hypothetical protein